MHAEVDLLRRGKSIRDRRRDERRLRGLMVGAAGLLVPVLAVPGTEQVMEWRSRALQGASSLVRPALQGSIKPRDPGLPDTLIDLSAVYNAPLGEPWYPGPEANTLESLPAERLHFLHGAVFWHGAA